MKKSTKNKNLKLMEPLNYSKLVSITNIIDFFKQIFHMIIQQDFVEKTF